MRNKIDTELNYTGDHPICHFHTSSEGRNFGYLKVGCPNRLIFRTNTKNMFIFAYLVKFKEKIIAFFGAQFEYKSKQI